MHATEKFVYAYAIGMVVFFLFAGFSTAAHAAPEVQFGPFCGGGYVYDDCIGAAERLSDDGLVGSVLRADGGLPGHRAPGF